MAENQPLVQLRLSMEQPPQNSIVIHAPGSARVASLDVFRGLCVLLMMLVDYGGAIFPIISHAPWNGVHLADFVMPFFLFVSGVSVAIAYKKPTDKVDSTRKALSRALKLFLLGVFLQGGYFHGASSLTYGVDIEKIRIFGILQRITIGYIVAALCEIWLPCRQGKGDTSRRNCNWQWCVILVLSVIYLVFLYGLYVPDWQFNVVLPDSSTAANTTYAYMVNCSVRGDLSPACNSAGMIDRYILGINHLYTKPVYKNLKDCNIISSHSQGPLTSPPWCFASFDPEGILSSLTAAATCIIGLQYGHILVQLHHHKDRLRNWLKLSVSLMCCGLFLCFLGMPLNKSLYTVSYMMVTVATAGFTFCMFYIMVDVCGWRWCSWVLEWMGKHALNIFILITSNIVVIMLQGFYLKHPENNLVRWTITRFVNK